MNREMALKDILKMGKYAGEIGENVGYKALRGQFAEEGNRAIRELATQSRLHNVATHPNYPGFAKTNLDLGGMIDSHQMGLGQSVTTPEMYRSAATGVGKGAHDAAGAVLPTRVASATTAAETGTQAAAQTAATAAEVNTAAGAATTKPVGAGGWGGVVEHVMDNARWGKGVMLGGAFGGGAALVGSAAYGGARIMTPNNAEVENPFKNAVKGVSVGIAAGAIAAATHSLSARNLVSPELGRSLTNVKTGARMVNGALTSKLTIGALTAAIAAGSGDVNFTRPINPVY